MRTLKNVVMFVGLLGYGLFIAAMLLSMGLLLIGGICIELAQTTFNSKKYPHLGDWTFAQLGRDLSRL